MVIKDTQAGVITAAFPWLPNSTPATLDSLFAFHMRGGAGGCGTEREDRFPSESFLTHSLFPPKISKLIWNNTGFRKEFDLSGSSPVLPRAYWFQSFR